MVGRWYAFPHPRPAAGDPFWDPAASPFAFTKSKRACGVHQKYPAFHQAGSGPAVGIIDRLTTK